MWKYIITWVLTTMVTVPCPTATTVDEFGTGNSYTISCMVHHTSTTHQVKEKVFFSRDSAIAFYNKGKSKINPYGIVGLGDDITEIKIDSVFVKK